MGVPMSVTRGAISRRARAVFRTSGCYVVARARGTLEKLERAKGFEPSTPTLARSCSTPELHPHPADAYHTRGGGLQALALPASEPTSFALTPFPPSSQPMPPPSTPDQLFARLDALGIGHRTYRHPPVFTVTEAV